MHIPAAMGALPPLQGEGWGGDGFNMKGQTNRNILDNHLQRNLRNTMTDAERALWKALRGQQMAGYKFRRQHPFENYILDFVCLDKMLVVEVDGSQHVEHADFDEERSRQLAKAGFRVVRFWNNEVLTQIDAVKERIWGELQ